MDEDLSFSLDDKLVIAACAISMLIVQMDWFALNLAGIPAEFARWNAFANVTRCHTRMPVMAAYAIGISRIRSVVTVTTYRSARSSPKMTR